VSQVIVDCDEESEQDGLISEQFGGSTRGNSCGIDSGSRDNESTSPPHVFGFSSKKKKRKSQIE
jgi:hypothetical protein